MSDPIKWSGPRLVRRKPTAQGSGRPWLTWRPVEWWRTVRAYFGLGRAAPPEPIDSPESLQRFIASRAAFIAQTSLYGYLRTRAGMRYPELFDDDEFVVGINHAKWQIWLDCLGDVAVYAGSRIAQTTPGQVALVGDMIEGIVADLLAQTGTPSDAGPEFAAHTQRLRQRLQCTEWLSVGDAEAAFSESPAAVVRWSPVMEELKALDEEIVLNSVRFRWQDVRRQFARDLVADAVIAGLTSGHASPP